MADFGCTWLHLAVLLFLLLFLCFFGFFRKPIGYSRNRMVLWIHPVYKLYTKCLPPILFPILPNSRQSVLHPRKRKRGGRSLPMMFPERSISSFLTCIATVHLCAAVWIVSTSVIYPKNLPCSLCFTAPPTFVCVDRSHISWVGFRSIFAIDDDPLVLFARAQAFFKFLYPICQPDDFSRHLFLSKHSRHRPFVLLRHSKNPGYGL